MQFTITREFVLGGKAVFTVSNPEGQHYTFKVVGKNFDDKSKDAIPTIYFVNLLTGPDNMSDYTYLGVLDIQTGALRHSAKSRWDRNNPPLPVKVFSYFLRHFIWQGEAMPEGYGIDGAGRCGRCGRVLTHPDGVNPDGDRYGFGPECWQKVQHLFPAKEEAA